MLPDGSVRTADTRHFGQNESGVFTGRGRASRIPRWIRSLAGTLGWFRLWAASRNLGCANASGLVWTGPKQVMFSKIRKSPPHGDRCCRGEPNRRGVTFYVPCGRTRHGTPVPSRHPTEKWAPSRGKWTKTTFGHLVAWFRWMAHHAVGKVGPPQSGPVRLRRGRLMRDGCTSPPTPEDSITSGRQRFPDGQPQQVTAGPTEEEGIAHVAQMAARL